MRLDGLEVQAMDEASVTANATFKYEAPGLR